MFSLFAYLITAKYYKRIVEKYDELAIVALFSAIVCFALDIPLIIILINNV